MNNVMSVTDAKTNICSGKLISLINCVVLFGLCHSANILESVKCWGLTCDSQKYIKQNPESVFIMF